MSSVHLSPVAWMQQLSQGDFFQAIGPFFDGSKLQAIFPDHRSVLSARVIEKSGHILGWILTFSLTLIIYCNFLLASQYLHFWLCKKNLR